MNKTATEVTPLLHFAGGQIDRQQRRLWLNGQPAALGGRAFDVLCVLVEHHRRPVPKDELLDAVWPQQDVEEGNLMVHISALRKLLGPQAITTVPGLGYRFSLGLEEGLTPLDSLPQEAPQPSEPGPRTNLPSHEAPLIGRDAVLAALHPLLDSQPLLSIVGPGGIGKTRLARSLAAQRLAHHADGVWWLDLAELSDGAELVARLGRLLGLPLQRAAQPLEALRKGLRRLDALLVLDNTEHLQDECAALVADLLEQAPGVRWLITSQEPLKLALEQVYRLDTLAVPPVGTPLTPALEYGALALLVARACACDRRFVLTEARLPQAIELCRQLDGIALAIEMAAARLPWLGWDGVWQRLDERLKLLVTDQRHAPARQRTLQAALDWSHSLLSPTEQAVYRRLAVFRGGLTLALALPVVADAHILTHWDALDALGALVDKSLVQVLHDDSRPQPRYRLLESTRLDAQARAEAAGETKTQARAHAQVLAHWAHSASQALWQQPDWQWLREAEPELDNLRSALAYAVAEQHSALAAPLYETLVWLNNLLAGATEARHWAPAIEALAEQAADADAGRLWLHLGSTFRNNAPPRAVACYQRASACFARSQYPEGEFRALTGLTMSLARLGDTAQAQALLAQAQQRVQPSWPPRLTMFIEEAQAFWSTFAGQPEQARQHYRRYRSLAQQAGAEGALVVASTNLADIALAVGDVAEAVRIGREHVAHLRRQRNLYALGWALGNLTGALVAQGALDEALACGREALPLMRNEEYASWLFDPLALLATLRGQPTLAAQLLGYADAARQRDGSPREPTEAAAYHRAQRLLTEQLGAAQLAQWQATGRQLSDAQADALVMDLGG